MDDAGALAEFLKQRARYTRDVRTALDKQPDVFAHISDVMEFMGDQLEVGQRVTFELGQRPQKSGKTKAVNVRIS